MTIDDELKLEAKAAGIVAKWLERKGSPARPDELSSSTEEPIPPYVLRRAVWALVASGKAEFTSDNRVQIRT